MIEIQWFKIGLLFFTLITCKMIQFNNVMILTKEVYYGLKLTGKNVSVVLKHPVIILIGLI